ncbi:MAG: hypothetical protein KDA60_14005, partial [Planctomycetales bacterium]|nr:hypothetical protein [Planctomycetales bacterium]
MSDGRRPDRRHDYGEYRSHVTISTRASAWKERRCQGSQFNLLLAESELQKSALAQSGIREVPGIERPPTILVCDDLILFTRVAGRSRPRLAVDSDFDQGMNHEGHE